MNASSHLRGLVIAGALAAVALALGFFTLEMNKSGSPAAPQPLTRTPAAVTPATAKGHKKVVKPKPPNPNLVAALKVGLPRSIANGLASHRVVVIALTSAADPVAAIAAREAQAGAHLAGASFVQIGVDRNGGDVSTLTRILGSLPVAPATLVYARPSTLVVTMLGFNDKTTVQQAAINAAAAPVVDPATVTTTTTTTTPATATTTPPVAVIPPGGSD